MSVSSISLSSFFNSNPQGIQSTRQRFLQEFQQLGHDLKSGDLSATQSDFATLKAGDPAAYQLGRPVPDINFTVDHTLPPVLDGSPQGGVPQANSISVKMHTGGFAGGVGDPAAYQLGRPVPDVNFTVDHTLPPVLDGSLQGGVPQAKSISVNA